MATSLDFPPKENHADRPIRANKIVEVWKGLMVRSFAEELFGLGAG
jgi:hypothetical protein